MKSVKMLCAIIMVAVVLIGCTSSKNVSDIPSEMVDNVIKKSKKKFTKEELKYLQELKDVAEIYEKNMNIYQELAEEIEKSEGWLKSGSTLFDDLSTMVKDVTAASITLVLLKDRGLVPERFAEFNKTYVASIRLLSESSLNNMEGLKNFDEESLETAVVSEELSTEFYADSIELLKEALE